MHNCSIFSNDLRIEGVSYHQLKEKPPVKNLAFGKHFTDHMLRIKWSESKGWDSPVICQLQNFEIHPAAKVCSFQLDLHDLI